MVDVLLSILKKYWQGILAAVALVAAFLNLGSLVNWVRSIVAAGAAPDSSGQLMLSPGWGWALAIFVLLFLANTWHSVSLFVESRKKRHDAKKIRTAEKTLKGMMQASNRIVNQLYPPSAEEPPFVFKRVERTYLVLANGDTTDIAKYSIEAYERPLNFWRIELAAESAATPVDFLIDIDFQIWDELQPDGDGIAYLVTENNRHRKEISVFFLPHMTPGGEARNIRFTYTWPAMVRQLLSDGEEDFSLTLKSRLPVEEFVYSIFFHPSLERSYSLDCRKLSQPVSGEALERIRSEELGWQGYRYRVTNARGEGFKYVFRVTATQNKAAQ